MSGFKPYPAYKDSGVEWVGEVPEYWAVHPLKRAMERIESGTSVNAADFPAEPGSLGVLKTSCVYTGKFDWTENKTVDDEDLSRVSCPLMKNTLIVSRMNTPDLVGATGLVTEAPDGIFLPDRLWQVYFLENHSPEFLFYFTKSREYREQVKMACSGTSASMQNLGQDDFRSVFFAEPPKREQTLIAHFLDHESARIDALIEEQQRLIELLQEKRQAVISHAVTKGLDSTVPMKDSGVEWLGRVPVHWRNRKLKWLFKQSKRQGYTDMEVLSVYRDYGVIKKSSREDNNNKTPEDLSLYQLVMAGDLVVNKMKAWQGSLGVSEHLGITSPDYVVYSPSNDEVPKFMHYLLRASHMPGVYLSISNGIRPSQWRIEPEKFEQIEVFLPGKTEQLKIVAYLEAQTGKFNELILCCEQASKFFSERRAALISAAVTGKIDVRGWQPPASVSSPVLEEEAV